ncbi:MAG: HD-GYP domain-containing protein [Rubripirellula sp.]|nr:HD-GYP domain-containing protein [Planctomycetaceae bacterium]MDF1841999.1 HD-GYP domain-containing protein [Rubripirellula sp.]
MLSADKSAITSDNPVPSQTDLPSIAVLAATVPQPPAPIQSGPVAATIPAFPSTNDEQKDTIPALYPTEICLNHAPSSTLENELQEMAQALSIKFEELTLLHQLSERLRLDEASGQVCHSLLEELAPCLDAIWVAIDLPSDDQGRQDDSFYQIGNAGKPEWVRDLADYTEQQSIVKNAGDESFGVPVGIVNTPNATAPANVRTIVVPIQRQDQNLGRMIAVRTLEQAEFGTVEADLMKSTSMMLGFHLINQRQYQEMQQMFEGTIQSLVSALDAKDTYTCGHSSRVAEVAVAIAKRLGFDEEGVTRIRMAGVLHDIGKIGVQDSVLCKPGKLTDEEFEQIKAHPVLGYDILQGIRQFNQILPAVRHHHEAWDGTGYPDGLAGRAIPRDAQLLAVADAFDAMTSDRPYRSGMPLEKVTSILRNGRGTQWAADVVDALLDSPEILKQYELRKNQQAEQN